MWEISEIFGTRRANNDLKVVARRNFFIEKPSKTAFFSFREFTGVERRKNEIFQINLIRLCELAKRW